MNQLKRLAIIAFIFCPPLGIAGWVASRYSLRWGYYLYITAILFFCFFITVLAFITYWVGGALVHPMGSFF